MTTLDSRAHRTHGKFGPSRLFSERKLRRSARRTRHGILQPSVPGTLAVCAALGLTSALLALVPTMAPVLAADGETKVPSVLQPGLVPDLSTATTSTYRETNGSLTLHSYATRVNYQDASGHWLPIDNTLINAPGQAYAVQNAANNYTAEIPQDPSSTPVKFSIGDDWATMRLHGVDDAPQVDGDSATFDNLPRAKALTYQATGEGLKEDITLAAPPDPTKPALTFVYTLDTSTGLTPTLASDGSIQFARPNGHVVFEMPVGTMADSASTPATTSNVDYQLVQANGTWTLTVVPEAEWLASPDRVYPVTIDPSLNQKPDSLDCFLGTANPDGSHCGNGSLHLKAGKEDATHKYRSLLTFDVSSIPSAAVIGPSSIYMYLDTTQTTGGSNSAEYGFFTPGKSFDSTASWNSAGASGSWTGGSPGATQYGSLVLSGSGNSGYRIFGGIDSLVQGWVSGSIPNRGVVFKQVGETTLNSIGFLSSSTANPSSERPYITVNYNTAPLLPTGIGVSPGNVGYSTSLTPTISAKVTDPDGTPVRGDFQVLLGSTVVWSGNSTPLVASGGTASVQVPSSKLTNGNTYSVKVEADDGSATSGYAVIPLTMKVDTTAPTATITSTGFTNGQWTATAPPANTFTFAGPSDINSFSYTEDGTQVGIVGAGLSGTASINWNPSSGGHILTVQPIDNAGNTGHAVSFSFGVGSAGLVTPDPLERSTGAFPIQATGAPGATSANIFWRYATSTTWNPASQVATAAGSSYGGQVSDLGPGGSATTGFLVWTASDEADPGSATGDLVDAPALLEVRVCFTYSAGPQGCTATRQIQLVPSGFSSNGATTQVGPAEIALTTGEAAITAGDAVDVNAGVGRTFTSFDAATLINGPFGPGWSAQSLTDASGATAASVVDNRAKDGTFVLVTPGNASETYVLVSGSTNVYQPAGPDDGSRLKLANGVLTLTELQAGTTSWQSDSGQWDLVSSEDPGASPASVSVSGSAGQVNWLSQVPAGTTATCTAAAQTPGCRGLTLVYASGHVTEVDEVSYDPKTGSDGLPSADAGFDSIPVATYSYDAQGRLSKVCDPRISQTNGSCVSYTYVVIGGRTLLASATPPGELSWVFGYDGRGRLCTVKRALDPAPPSGSPDAVWTVDYDVSPNATGLPDLSSGTLTTWGQTVAPTTATAVFPPSHVPATTPTSADFPYAQVWYATTDGTNTNVARYGGAQWLVDTLWHDPHGNVVQELSAVARAEVLAASAADRPGLVLEESTFTTYSNDGARVEDQYGPTHVAELKNGTVGRFRNHIAYTYDDEAPSLAVGAPSPPAGATSLNLVVEQDETTSLPDMTGDTDVVVSRNEYAPIVAGDGSGWTFGTPSRVKTQLSDGSWATQTQRLNSNGQVIELRMDGGSTAADGSGNDAHSQVTVYYTSDGSASDPSCRNQPAWAGLVCISGPAAQPNGDPIPVSHDLAYNKWLMPTREEDRSGATTVTTILSYDGAGRPTGEAKSVAGGNASDPAQLAASITYAADGQASSWSAGGKTVSQTFDGWGRVNQTTDATGLQSTTGYTVDGNVATLNDGMGQYSYSYGSTSDHRPLVSAVASGVGTFAISYNADDAPTTVTYPNGLTATHTYDEAGYQTGLSYTSAGADVMSFNAILNSGGDIVGETTPSDAIDYSFDNSGRLLTSQHVGAAGCRTTKYSFDGMSDRSGATSFDAAADGSCQTSTPATSWTGTYDAASRLTNDGYSYDNLGRVRTIPAGDTAAGAASQLTATYFPDNMTASTSQSVLDDDGMSDDITESHTLDPAERIQSTVTTINGVENGRVQYRYSDTSDVPTSVGNSVDGGATYHYTRYLSLPGLGEVGSVSGDDLTLGLTDLHGNVVGTQDSTTGPGAVANYQEFNEFGTGGSSSVPYGWKGSSEKVTGLGGLVSLGARIYNPVTGQFTSPDSVIGGNATSYAYPEDPINSEDLQGTNRTHGDLGGPGCPCAHNGEYNWNSMSIGHYVTGAWHSATLASLGPSGEHLKVLAMARLAAWRLLRLTDLWGVDGVGIHFRVTVSAINKCVNHFWRRVNVSYNHQYQGRLHVSVADGLIPGLHHGFWLTGYWVGVF